MGWFLHTNPRAGPGIAINEANAASIITGSLMRATRGQREGMINQPQIITH